MGMAAFSWIKKVVATVVVAADGTGDTDDIQEGIDMLPAGGGVVYIKEGTYIITSTIIITSSNVSLIGAGRGTRIQTTNDITMLEVYLAASTLTGVVIDKLYFLGDPTQANNIGIYMRDTENCVILFCWVENTGDTAIETNNAEGVRISSNWILEPQGDGIHTEENDNTIIESNYIYSPEKVGILFTNSEKNQILNNTVYSSRSWGLLLDGDYNIIRGNLMDSCGRAGINAGIGIAQNHNLILENIIIESQKDGISIIGGGNNVINGNLVENSDRDNTGTYNGISLTESDYNIISNNRLKNNDRYEINILNAECEKNLVGNQGDLDLANSLPPLQGHLP